MGFLPFLHFFFTSLVALIFWSIDLLIVSHCGLNFPFPNNNWFFHLFIILLTSWLTSLENAVWSFIYFQVGLLGELALDLWLFTYFECRVLLSHMVYRCFLCSHMLFSLYWQFPLLYESLFDAVLYVTFYICSLWFLLPNVHHQNQCQVNFSLCFLPGML